MFKQNMYIKWYVLIVISVISVILNVSQESFSATIDAEMSRDAKQKRVHVNARNVYNHYCVHCHGLEGKGDGRSFAYELKPKPRDFTDPEYMAKLTDEDIRKVIVGGSASVGKSNLCPAWSDTFSNKDYGTDGVDELVAYIRAFSAPLPEKKKAIETIPEEIQEETANVKPFIVWPILILITAFFISIAVFEWRKT